jgi:hypothetical protein
VAFREAEATSFGDTRNATECVPYRDIFGSVRKNGEE